MKMKKILLLALSVVFFASCEKSEVTGCTDSSALNYSNLATKDDGSCIASTVVEEFTLTFGPSSAEDYYDPNFNYESGDVIIIETLNEWDEWTSLPYILDVDVHIQGAYDNIGDVWIYLNEDDGISYYPSTDLTLQFRAALIKASALKINPDLKFKTIKELKTIN